MYPNDFECSSTISSYISIPARHVPYFDGSNYACWRNKMIVYLNDMIPKVLLMINVSMPQLFDLNTLTNAQKKCQDIEDHAT